MTNDPPSEPTSEPSSNGNVSEPRRRGWKLLVLGIVCGLIAIGLVFTEDSTPLHGNVRLDAVEARIIAPGGSRDLFKLSNESAREITRLINDCRVLQSYRKGGPVREILNRFKRPIAMPDSVGTEQIIFPMTNGEVVHVEFGHRDGEIFAIRAMSPEEAGGRTKPNEIFKEVFACDCGESLREIQAILRAAE